MPEAPEVHVSLVLRGVFATSGSYSVLVVLLMLMKFMDCTAFVSPIRPGPVSKALGISSIYRHDLNISGWAMFDIVACVESTENMWVI